MTTTKTKRRELVTLAKPIDNAKRPKIAGWCVSEKLDGTRCFWDGGVTRGLPTVDVPWASVLHPKTLKPKDKIKPVSTGLWSRYGNPIMAPDWFLDALPCVMLDGELWAGRGEFQTCRSIVAGDCGDDRWRQVKYMVYGTPSLEVMTVPGLIKNANYYCEIKDEALQDMLHIICRRPHRAIGWATPETPFAESIEFLHDWIKDACEYCEVHLQTFLPQDEAQAWEAVEGRMAKVLGLGGEGLIIRNPAAVYEIKRTANLLKFKSCEDAEGVLVGYTAGSGKYEGMIGALVLDFNGKRLELSGMTDDERQFIGTPHGLQPGKDVSIGFKAKHFNLGDTITFQYRELSDAGVPKEAAYLRVRGDA
jgi:DNA ligase-1